MACKVQFSTTPAKGMEALQESSRGSAQQMEERKWNQLMESHHDKCDRVNCKRVSGLLVCQLSHMDTRAHNDLVRYKRRMDAYKTKLCRNFHGHGYCLDGKKCRFLHNIWEPEDPEVNNFFLQNEVSATFKPSSSAFSSVFSSHALKEAFCGPEVVDLGSKEIKSYGNVFSTSFTRRPGPSIGSVNPGCNCCGHARLSHCSSSSSGISSICATTSHKDVPSQGYYKGNITGGSSAFASDNYYGSPDAFIQPQQQEPAITRYNSPPKVYQQQVPSEKYTQLPSFFEAPSGDMLTDSLDLDSRSRFCSSDSGYLNGNNNIQGDRFNASNSCFAPSNAYRQQPQQFEEYQHQQQHWPKEDYVQPQNFFGSPNVYSVQSSSGWSNGY